LVEGFASIVGVKGGWLQPTGGTSVEPSLASALGCAQVSKLIVVSSGLAQELGSRMNGRGVPTAGQKPSSSEHWALTASWLGSHGVPQIVIRAAVTRWASVRLCR
jgi:hypothetical protein